MFFKKLGTRRDSQTFIDQSLNQYHWNYVTLPALMFCINKAILMAETRLCAGWGEIKNHEKLASTVEKTLWNRRIGTECQWFIQWCLKTSVAKVLICSFLQSLNLWSKPPHISNKNSFRLVWNLLGKFPIKRKIWLFALTYGFSLTLFQVQFTHQSGYWEIEHDPG